MPPIRQDILDRLLGIYDVHISTATVSSGRAAHIDGVEKDCAEKVRKIILDRIISKWVSLSDKLWMTVESVDLLIKFV